MPKIEGVHIVLDVGITSDLWPGTQDVSMIIDPALSLYEVGNRLRLIEEGGSILTDENELFVEKEIVNPPHLTGGAVIRYVPRAISSFL